MMTLDPGLCDHDEEHWRELLLNAYDLGYRQALIEFGFIEKEKL